MSSSDEDFESADESLDEDKSIKNRTELKHEKPLKPDDNKKQQIINKSIENVADVISRQVDMDKSKKEDKPLEKDTTGEGWDDFEEWPKEEKFEKTSEIVIAETKEVKNLESFVKDENFENADGWDVDDWGDVDDEPSTVNPPNPKTKQKNEPQNVSNVIDKLSNKENQQSSWGGWKPWGGVVSLLSTASEGVAHLTTNVSKGISNVIESGIGIPDAEELAKQQAEEMKQSQELQRDPNAQTPSGLTVQSRKDESFLSLGQNFVTGVTQISNRVISGGLDTLEGIGKKTMTMLQQDDPLLINKRKMLGLETNRPVLSQVLREAKQKTEEAERNLKHMQKHLYKKQIHFETLFDDYHGLVHLEALEMLSKQSALKLQSLMTPLSGKALQDLQETLGEVNELCELSEPEDDSDGLQTVEELSEKLSTAVEDLGVPVDFREILK